MKSYGKDRLLLFFGLLLFLPSFLSAQPGSNTGLIFDEESYQSFPSYDRGSIKNIDPPKSVSLRAHTPYPKSQGPIASCVGWAVGYGAMTTQRAAAQRLTNRHLITKEYAHSASYIFNQVKQGQDCFRGASLVDALRLITREGAALEKSFPSSTTQCTPVPDNNMLVNGRAYRLKSVAARIFDPSTDRKRKERIIKQQLAVGNPVIVGMSRTPNYRQLKDRKVWYNEGPSKGHAMVVIGYDDGQAAFELMNSYGYQWGDRGFIWVPYEDFHAMVQEAYVLQRKAASKGGQEEVAVAVPIKLEAQMDLLFAAKGEDYQRTKMMWKGGTHCYVPERSAWQRNQGLFKLALTIPAGCHAYLLNFDTDQRGQLLWSMADYHRDTTLVFPQEAAILFSTPGVEHLALLLSYEAIPDIEAKLQRLRFQVAESSMADRLALVFKDFLIPQPFIRYQSDQMQLLSQSRHGQGTAVYLLLRMQIE